MITVIILIKLLLCTRHCVNQFTFNIHVTDKETKEQRCDLILGLHN